MGPSFYTRHTRAHGGFTLIEMLIVLAIIVIITAIAIGGQQNFDRTLSLNNTAYSVALSLRQAQSYGLSSKLYTAARNTGYGISTVVGTGAITTYTLFADTCTPVTATDNPDVKPGNGYYDLSSPTTAVCSASEISAEKVTAYTLNNGFTINHFCAQNSASNWKCSHSTLASNRITNLDIVFRRPEADARIKAHIEGAASYGSNYISACFSITRTGGTDTRSVSVSEAGQISVSNKICGPATP